MKSGIFFPVCTIMTVLMIVLQLGGVIAWSWWVIFLPVLICAGLLVVILAAALIFILVEDNLN